MAKLNIAKYWASSCGGCCVSLLDTHEKILDIADVADIVFWPIALDTKYKDVEEMPDNFIDVCFFNGAIRNSENEHLAKLLRKKSKILVAYGACAVIGGVPGLANRYSREEIFNEIFFTVSTENKNRILPKTISKVKEGELELPELYDNVYALNQIVDVDYYLPGCPPPAKNVAAVIDTIVANKLPQKGSIVGAGNKSVCDECKRKRDLKKITGIKRIHLVDPGDIDPEVCLLEQGILCMGIATRSGCEALCINSGNTCKGCFGPTPEVSDQGAKAISAIASVIESNDEKEVNRIINEIVDPIGTFYRYSLPKSILGRSVRCQKK